MSKTRPQSTTSAILKYLSGKAREVTGLLTGERGLRHQGRRQSEHGRAELHLVRRETQGQHSRAEAYMSTVTRRT